MQSCKPTKSHPAFPSVPPFQQDKTGTFPSIHPFQQSKTGGKYATLGSSDISLCWVRLSTAEPTIVLPCRTSNLQCCSLTTSLSLQFPTSTQNLSGTDSQAATLSCPPRPISPHFHDSSQTISMHSHRDCVLRLGGVLHRLGRCDWFLCCHCGLLAAAC